jgi:hypothetical protein
MYIDCNTKYSVIDTLTHSLSHSLTPSLPHSLTYLSIFPFDEHRLENKITSNSNSNSASRSEHLARFSDSHSWQEIASSKRAIMAFITKYCPPLPIGTSTSISASTKKLLADATVELDAGTAAANDNSVHSMPVSPTLSTTDSLSNSSLKTPERRHTHEAPKYTNSGIVHLIDMYFKELHSASFAGGTTLHRSASLVSHAFDQSTDRAHCVVVAACWTQELQKKCLQLYEKIEPCILANTSDKLVIHCDGSSTCTHSYSGLHNPPTDVLLLVTA